MKNSHPKDKEKRQKPNSYLPKEYIQMANSRWKGGQHYLSCKM